MKYQNLYDASLGGVIGHGTDGYDPAVATANNPNKRGFEPTLIPTLNRALEASGIAIYTDIPHDGDDAPYYNSADNTIHLPTPQAFSTPELYTHAVAHEFAHYVGKRLRQSTAGPYNIWDMMEAKNVKEELRAELAAALFEQQTLGKLATPANTYSYLHGTLQYINKEEGTAKQHLWTAAEEDADKRVAEMVRLGAA